MRPRFALVVPAVGHVRILAVAPDQARARHAEAAEFGLREVADVQAQPLRGAAVLDDELQQDHAFARIAEARAGVEVDAQLLVGLDEPEVVEAGRVRQAHAWRDRLPARIAGQVLVGAVLVRERGVGRVLGQRLVEVVLQRHVQLEPALVHQLQHRPGEDGLGERGAVHHRVARQRIALGVAQAEGVDEADPAAIDHRDREALRVRARHHLADLRGDRRAVGQLARARGEREGQPPECGREPRNQR